jgi:hypothetical protein
MGPFFFGSADLLSLIPTFVDKLRLLPFEVGNLTLGFKDYRGTYSCAQAHGARFDCLPSA